MAESTHQRFAGRVAIVTGGASGIGAAAAQRLAREGAAVVITDVATEGVEQVAKDVCTDGGRARAVRADVTDEADWQRVVAQAAEAFGGVDVLVNNACAWEITPAHELSPDGWRRQLDACLTSAYLGFHACHPQLEARAGSVVNVSSVHALVGIPGHPAYAAAKGGVVALTRQLAVEYGPRIRANTVLPGPILTAAWGRVPEADRLRAIETTVAGRMGAPEEVAAAIAFLASDDASYITGTTLLVDGGWSACK